MRRKHSIALGINAVLSVAYLLLIAWNLYSVMHEYESQQEFLSLQEVAKNLLPHLAVMAIASGLTIIAFFSSFFAVSLMAVFAYGAAIALAATEFYQYALLCSPWLLLAIIGSTFCYKRKQFLKEQEEERRYLATHPRPKVKRSGNSSYVDRMKKSGNYFRQPTDQGQGQTHYYQQNQNVYGNPADFYYQQAQQPLLPQQLYNPLQDPYAPLSAPMQPVNYMNPYAYQPTAYNAGVNQNDTMQKASPPVTNAENMMVSPLYPAVTNQPMALPQANPMINPMAGNVLNYPQPAGKPTRSEGYFDDYGNFHPGSNNF